MYLSALIVGFISGIFFALFAPFQKLFRTNISFSLFLVVLMVMAVVAAMWGK